MRIRQYGMAICSLLLLEGCANRTMNNTKPNVFQGQKVDSEDPISRGTVLLLKDGKPQCSGLMIGPRHVLTAAHCFVPPGQMNLEATFGVDPQAEGAPRIRVTRIMLHKAFGAKPPWLLSEPRGDIAIAELADDAPTTRHIIRTVGREYVISEGAELVLYGYGISPENEHRAGTLFSAKTSVDKKSKPDAAGLEWEFSIPSSPQSPGLCAGDSGGPVFVQANGELRTLGVASKGVPSCTGVKGQYGNIPGYLDWIARTAGIDPSTGESHAISIGDDVRVIEMTQ